ncbi:MAG: putative Ig domain-containing protein, partial [Planctomycetes bacterium]|nr:putative Ig domain-containing protein [Planctomycetota bacterium]
TSGLTSFVGGIATVEPRVAEGGTFTLVVRPGLQPAAVDEFSETITIDFETVDGRGPFLGLKSVRVGTEYADSVAFAALPGTVATAPVFGVLDGALPDGIVLDATTGALSGAPTVPGDYGFTLWARQSDTELQPLRCSLAVFAADESDVATPPPDLSVPGPFAGQVTVVDEAAAFVSSFDGVAYSTAYRAWVPPEVARPAPVLVWHHGRTVGFEEYGALGQHLASWGIAFVSVEDDVSFRASSGVPDPNYDQVVIEAGIESGAAFLEAVADDLDARTQNVGDPLEGMFDLDKLFFGGHERGGGSAQAAHTRWRENKARGYVYASALDLRFSTFTIPPGDPRGTAMYPIETDLPRSPSLVFSAELDFDMFFPVPDQFADRRTGPTSFVTIYGGVGSYMTDAAAYDAPNALITRAAQHAHLFRYTTAFIQRWCGDRSLDGLLYGDADAGSEQVGAFGWRNMVERILVDDFQDDDPSTNLLGLPNTLSAASRNEESVYPMLGGFPSLGIRHNVVFLSGTDAADYMTELGGLDVSARRKLAFRIGQTTDFGFDWVTVTARLVDGVGGSADVIVWDAMTQVGILPDYDVASSLNTYERFVGVEVALDAFVGIDLTDVARLELVFETDGTFDVARRVYFDDLRFE